MKEIQMEPTEFRAFPKIARLNRDIIITEKIDGTNAAIGVTKEGVAYAQSRTRIITPENDNFGFAGWVKKNADLLVDTLGVGLHFGEWWGLGIQRGYGLVERRFSLFNASKWVEPLPLAALRVVPVLYEGPMSTAAIEEALDLLRFTGSFAEPGYMKPEGIVIFHTGGLNNMFKVTLENDDKPKGGDLA